MRVLLICLVQPFKALVLFSKAHVTAERLKLFCTVCSAVEYAHQHHVVHRDLKPRNMLVLARRTRAASLTPGATPDRRRRLRREGPPSACFTFDDGLKRLVDSLPALRGHTITDG